MQPEFIKAFQTALLEWFKKNHRLLPWRMQPSLYRTVVSEFMLQQTQVTTVIPYFERWMERFPDFDSLAAADEADVLKAWEGLGYYSRARNLHAVARTYVSADNKPESAESWQVYKGIGAYTSSAIASIAHGEPVAVVDGNVVRVLSRLTADGTIFKTNSDAVDHFRLLAQSLISANEPGNYNEAIMELGATICTKHHPLCLKCPVSSVCLAAKNSDACSYPKLTRKKTENVARSLFLCIHNQTLLLEQRHSNARRLAKTWELPEISVLGEDFKLTPDTHITDTRTRGISNQRIRETLYTLPPTAGLVARIETNERLRFIPFADIEQLQLSGPHKKWILCLLYSD